MDAVTEQSRLCDQNLMVVGDYFEQRIQSNIYCGPCKYNHLYTYKRKYLVWWHTA